MSGAPSTTWSAGKLWKFQCAMSGVWNRIKDLWIEPWLSLLQEETRLRVLQLHHTHLEPESHLVCGSQSIHYAERALQAPHDEVHALGEDCPSSKGMIWWYVIKRNDTDINIHVTMIWFQDVEPATRQNFRLKTGAHSAIVAIVKPIKGPQGRQRRSGL